MYDNYAIVIYENNKSYHFSYRFVWDKKVEIEDTYTLSSSYFKIYVLGTRYGPILSVLVKMTFEKLSSRFKRFKAV